MADVGSRASGTRSVRLGVVSLCLVQFVDVLGVTVMVTALPAMLSDLHTSAGCGQLDLHWLRHVLRWVADVWCAAGRPVWSPADHLHRPGDLRRGCCHGCDGSVSSGADGSQVPARCGRGTVGAVGVAAADHDHPDGPGRERAIAGWSASGAAAGASGFVIGGVVTYLVGWRAVFWGYLPVAVLLAGAIRRSVPPDHGVDRSVRLSVASAGTFTAAVMAFVVATTLLPEPGRAALGAALLAVAVSWPACSSPWTAARWRRCCPGRYLASGRCGRVRPGGC